MALAIQYAREGIFRKVKDAFHSVKVPCSRVLGKIGNISPNAVMLAVQLAGVFAVLFGISFWSVPCAFIVGGIAAVYAIERQGDHSAERGEDPVIEQRIRAQIDAALARGHNPFTGNAPVPFTSKWITYVALARRNHDVQN